MTPDESTDSVRVAAVADVLYAAQNDESSAEIMRDDYKHMASAVLASDWLADVVAQAKAEALAEAGADLNKEAVNFQAGWGPNEIDQAKLWAIGRCLAWLRDRAANEATS